MTDFSASDAALEGFQVLRKDWRVVVGWCLFSVIAFVGLLIVAVIAILFGTFASTTRDQAGMVGSVIGGLTLSTFITLLVMPVLYTFLERGQGTREA